MPENAKWSVKPINLLFYGVAMILPILVAVVLTDNTNETNPGLYWVGVPLLWAFAGYMTSRGHRAWLSWVLLSAGFGLIETAILIWSA